MAKLQPMRYKTYTWPYNPSQYSITFEKEVAAHKYPYKNGGDLEDLGTKPRIISGQGEFFGEGAYQEFRKLAAVFYDRGPGPLIHPVWDISNAIFKKLELTQEPLPNYVKYAFEFWEHISELQEDTIIVLNTTTQNSTNKTHVVVEGECLWTIANNNGLSLDQIISLNPQIKNPNLIYPGQTIVLG